MAAEITFDQPLGAGPGTAGKARNDIWLDQVVNMVSSGTGTTYSWELLNAPPGSAATVANPTLSTANITPDVMGTYRIRLTVDGGGVGNVVTKVIRARYDSAGVLYKRGWALPAVGEEEGEADYGTNDRHWDEAWQAITTGTRGALSKVFVFQPGGNTEGNTFADWADLMVALGETYGEVTIVVDTDWDDAIIPAGTWQMGSRTAIVGLYRNTLVQIAAGGVVRNPKELRYIAAQADATYTGYFLVSGFSNECHVYNSKLSNTSALQPILNVEMGNTVWLHNSQVQNKVAGAPSSVVTNSGFIGSNSVLYLDGYSSIDDETLNGTHDWVIYLNSVSTATTTHTNCSGTITINAPSGGGITTTFVYQPGGTAGDNVYTDWASLMTALAGTEGPKIIEFDASQDGNLRCDIPAGTHDLGGDTTLRGKPYFYGALSVASDVLMADGAIFQNALVLDGFLNVYSSSSSGVFTWSGHARKLVLRDHAFICGAQLGLASPPSAPLITALAAGVYIELYDSAALGASSGNQPVLYAVAGAHCFVDCFDGSVIGNATGGVGSLGTPLDTDGGGLTDILVNLHSSGVSYYHEIITGLSWKPYCVRREVIDLTKGVVTNSTATPASCGAGYVSFKNIPKFENCKCYFRVIIETTSGSVGYEAYIDLYDVYGQLNGGVPRVVPGSQMDTGTASPPTGAPTPNALLPGLYETDLTATILDSTWESDIAIFETRVWIGTEAGGNAATCKSAELVFEWTTEEALIPV